MKKHGLSLVLATALIAPMGMFAQTPDTNVSTQALTMSVGGSALIKVVQAADGANSVPIALTLGGPTQAGAAVTQNTANTTTRLRMTSFTSGTAETRKITASISDGNNEAWRFSNTRLEVALDPPVNQAAFVNYENYASGLQGLKILAEGVPGETLADDPTGGVNAAQDLVTGIRTAWSGTGVGDGYVIKYVFTLVNKNFQPQPVSGVTVKFTLTEG